MTDETSAQSPHMDPEPGRDSEGEDMAKVLDGISGIQERLALAKEQLSRGDGIPLDEL